MFVSTQTATNTTAAVKSVWEGWGGEGTELRTVCAHRWKSLCWILANRTFVGAGWMLKKHKQQQQQQKNAVARNTSHISAFWTVIRKLIGTFVGFLLSVFGVLEPWIKKPLSDEARLSCACCAAPEIHLNLCAGAATQLIRGNAPQTAAYGLSDIGHMESIHYDSVGKYRRRAFSFQFSLASNLYSTDRFLFIVLDYTDNSSPSWVLCGNILTLPPCHNSLHPPPTGGWLRIASWTFASSGVTAPSLAWSDQTARFWCTRSQALADLLGCLFATSWTHIAECVSSSQ